MLDYEKQIFLDILQEDGLVIAAKGLGLESVVVNLLKAHCDSGNLVFVLGTEGKEQEWLVKALSETITPAPRVVSSDVGVAERESSYLEGGVWFVPTRILVVDLLKKRIPIDLITGIVVCKAHGILKRHQDSFVLRLFRQGNKTGFIKAFSNHAAGFSGGLSKVEQILKALFVRKLFLWPRYHAAVKGCLSTCKPKVIELHLEMSGLMLQLQNALLDLVKLSIQEIKRLNPMLDTDEVTVENAISDSFHKLLHSQLDPVWHALSERTRLLLADLKLFHYLIRALITHDSISFYALVRAQRRSERVRQGSGWQLLPPAEILFTVASRRVHPSPQSTPDPEQNPKWLALVEVIGEIHRALKAGPQVVDIVEDALENMFQQKSDEKNLPGPILILTRNELTCTQLFSMLKFGSKQLLDQQYRKYFKKGADRVATSSESEISSQDSKNESEVEVPEDEEEHLGGTFELSLTQSAFRQLDSGLQSSIAGCFEESFRFTQSQSKVTHEVSQCDADNEDELVPVMVVKAWQKEHMELPLYLSELKPVWVIMYDVDITAVRQLEVYQRTLPTRSLTVYFLIYGGTVEEQAYLTTLRKEKEAFDFLIEEKGRLVVAEDRSDCPELSRDAGKANEDVAILVDSRRGGLSVEKGPTSVIVDMREFRSELPALIHARGIDIEPLTITVGDYILTPDICLERKSVSDLIQSLNSGRLYNQAQALTRNYLRPMLLIEFDKDKPFDLQDRYYLSTDTSSDQLVTKLQLLTMHFPKLRIVWSPCPQATAALFEELKQGHPQPDPATAIGIGVDETPNDLTFNPSIQSFLQQLPGVTSKNLTTLLRQGQSLDHLRRMTVDEISALVDNTAEAQALHGVFHKQYEPCDSDGANKKPFRSGALRGGKRKKFH